MRFFSCLPGEIEITNMNNKMAVTMFLSVVTLNVNGFNALIKRHRVSEWTGKQDSYIYCL